MLNIWRLLYTCRRFAFLRDLRYLVHSKYFKDKDTHVFRSITVQCRRDGPEYMLSTGRELHTPVIGPPPQTGTLHIPPAARGIFGPVGANGEVRVISLGGSGQVRKWGAYLPNSAYKYSGYSEYAQGARVRSAFWGLREDPYCDELVEVYHINGLTFSEVSYSGCKFERLMEDLYAGFVPPPELDRFFRARASRRACTGGPTMLIARHGFPTVARASDIDPVGYFRCPETRAESSCEDDSAEDTGGGGASDMDESEDMDENEDE
jgi:hypothetical protein